MQKKLSKNIVLVWIFLFCITQLSGCIVSKRTSFPDGPPEIDIDVSKIPDAVPKHEPLSRYGNKHYKIKGKHYRVLKSAKGYDKKGHASWYGRKFHGRRTSTQETYQLHDMTAASTELPLPTYVRVTNLLNGKKVIVKVNDRGPFKYHRLIDLSYAAAKKLGFANRGTAPVRVEAIDPSSHKKSAEIDSTVTNEEPKNIENLAQKSKPGIYMQVGSFAHLDRARQLSARINKLTNKHVVISHDMVADKKLYRVQIGPLANADQKAQLKATLEEHGLNI